MLSYNFKPLSLVIEINTLHIYRVMQEKDFVLENFPSQDMPSLQCCHCPSVRIGAVSRKSVSIYKHLDGHYSNSSH